MVFFRQHCCLASVLVLGLAVYFLCLPSTLQELDSNELVMAGYGLYVPHPPGYPLFTWFNYLLTHLLPGGTIFWRAALGSVLSLGGVLFLLGKSLQREHPMLPLWLLSFAFIPVVWRYAILPDVFAAHLFLVTLFLYFYLSYPFKNPDPKKALFLVAVAAIGGAHHQTFIFLYPLLIPVFWGMPRKVWIKGILLGGMILLGAYSSLMLLHPDALFSWGKVDNLAAVWRHFLRQDYGSWQLRPGEERPFSFWGAQITFWWQNFGCYFLPFWAGGLLPLFCGKFKQIPRPYYYLLGIILFYVLVFLGSINFSGDHLSGLVAQRFHLMSGVLIIFWLRTSLAAWPRQVKRWWPIISGLLAVVGLVQLKINYAEQDLSRNTIIEDYARNLLEVLPQNKPIIFITHGDTRYFALRYLQAVENLRPDILVMADGRLFPQEEFEKYDARWHQLQITPAGRGKVYDLAQDILGPNLKSYTICTDQHLNPSLAHTIFYPLGRCFIPGKGISFAPSTPFKWWRHDPAIIQSFGLNFREDLAVFTEYALYDLKQGMMATANGQEETAKEFFQKAAQRVPYALPPQINYCQLLDDSSQQQACWAHVQLLRQISFNYLP